MKWEDFAPWWYEATRSELFKSDLRDPLQKALYGRDVTLPTLTGVIGDTGRALSQRFLWPINASNRNSVQNTDTVLTASSGASTSTISIASHSVKFDFGTVAYNSGSISGLTPETLYYVYADDPDYDGGAVTYLATTNPDNLIAQGRYYVGYIVTPITGSSESIIGATATNPVELQTSAAHGWASGQQVVLDNLPGDFGTALNGNTYAITVTAVDKFTVPVDGLLFLPYTAGGDATRVTSAVQSGGGAGAGVGGARFDFAVP